MSVVWLWQRWRLVSKSVKNGYFYSILNGDAGCGSHAHRMMMMMMKMHCIHLSYAFDPGGNEYPFLAPIRPFKELK